MIGKQLADVVADVAKRCDVSASDVEVAFSVEFGFTVRVRISQQILNPKRGTTVERATASGSAAVVSNAADNAVDDVGFYRQMWTAINDRREKSRSAIRTKRKGA